jgi:hypothetical protein
MESVRIERIPRRESTISKTEHSRIDFSHGGIILPPGRDNATRLKTTLLATEQQP